MSYSGQVDHHLIHHPLFFCSSPFFLIVSSSQLREHELTLHRAESKVTQRTLGPEMAPSLTQLTGLPLHLKHRGHLSHHLSLPCGVTHEPV